MDGWFEFSRMIHPPGFKYAKAPIAEAVLDIRVQRLAPFELERLSGFVDPGYPESDHTVELQSSTEMSPLGVATQTSRKLSGYRFASSDGLQIALMTEDGFTFGRLAPYDNWSSFSSEALRIWESYAALAEPDAVTRLGLRYINQIERPPGDGSVDRYLRTRPEISDDMPTATTGFFLSMDIPLVEHQAMCRVTETLLGPERGFALVLDIDVGRPGQYDPRDLDTIRSTFDVLRDAKNMVFEGSITEAARELFQS